MKRDFRRRKQGAAPSFSVSNESADSWCRHGRHYFIWQRTSISITSSSPAWRVPTGFRWRESGRRAESESGGDGLLANPRSRPTPLSAFRPPPSESVGWLLLLFATEKQRKRKKIVHVLLRPKVPKASARRFPRECTSRGAARGAQDQAYAPPRDGRAAARPLFFRVKRECGFIVPPAAALLIIQCALEARINLLVLPASGCVSLLFRKTNHPRNSIFSFSARRFPTWFRWRKSGRKAESDSGGDGLLANPRSRPTPLSAFRTPTSESVGWLLLLFDTEKQRKKKKFSARRPKIAKGFRENFCCFLPPKSREKEKERDKNSSPHRKKCGSRVPSEAAI